MGTAASGIISEPKHNLRDMLAATTVFQTETGTSTAAAAKAFIHLGYHDDPGDDPGPLVVIETEEGQPAYELYAQGASNVLTGAGGLKLYLRSPDVGGADHTEGMTVFENYVGGVMDALAAAAGESGSLRITAISPSIAPQRTAVEEESQRSGNWWQCELSVQWGQL